MSGTHCPATAALHPGYILSPHDGRIILRMIQIVITGGTATAIETVLPIFPFRVGTNNVPTRWFVVTILYLDRCGSFLTASSLYLQQSLVIAIQPDSQFSGVGLSQNALVVFYFGEMVLTNAGLFR